MGSIPGLGISPGGGWQSTPVFLPGESNRQRSLGGYSPVGHKESEITEAVSMHARPIKTLESNNIFNV